MLLRDVHDRWVPNASGSGRPATHGRTATLIAEFDAPAGQAETVRQSVPRSIHVSEVMLSSERQPVLDTEGV